MKRKLIDDILDPNYHFEDEFLDADVSEDIETVCLNCGCTTLVPDFIYDEFSKKKYHFKLKKKVPTINCMECQKETAIPKSYLEK